MSSFFLSCLAQGVGDPCVFAFRFAGASLEKPIKHLETFSGTMEVTKHEWLDRGRVQKRW